MEVPVGSEVHNVRPGQLDLIGEATERESETMVRFPVELDSVGLFDGKHSILNEGNHQ